MNTLIQMRDRDFILRCIKIAKAERERGHSASCRRVALLAIYGGASSFYISFSRAWMLYNKYNRLSEEERMPRCTDTPAVQRAKHITKLVNDLMREKDLRFDEAMVKVLIGKSAPRFYFSVDYGMRLLNLYTKQAIVYDLDRKAV